MSINNEPKSVKEFFTFLVDFLQKAPNKNIVSYENKSEERLGQIVFLERGENNNLIQLTIDFMFDVDEYVIIKLCLTTNSQMEILTGDTIYALCNNSSRKPYQKIMKEFLKTANEEIQQVLSTSLESQIDGIWKNMK